MENFRSISNDKVRHVWFAPQDNDEQVSVRPDWYEQNGTPTSSDGEDMIYSHTEVDTGPKSETDILELLKASCKTSGMFYTAETKTEFDAWLANQQKGTPLAGVYAMAGFNYAMRQVQRILNGEIKKEQDNAG